MGFTGWSISGGLKAKTPCHSCTWRATVITLKIVPGIRKLKGRGAFTRARAISQAGVAQLVEHLICNQRVGGSNPFASSIFHR